MELNICKRISILLEKEQSFTCIIKVSCFVFIWVSNVALLRVTWIFKKPRYNGHPVITDTFSGPFGVRYNGVPLYIFIANKHDRSIRTAVHALDVVSLNKLINRLQNNNWKLKFLVSHLLPSSSSVWFWHRNPNNISIFCPLEAAISPLGSKPRQHE